MMLELRVSFEIDVFEVFELQVSSIDNVAIERAITSGIPANTEYYFEPLQAFLQVNRRFYCSFEIADRKICKILVFSDILR